MTRRGLDAIISIEKGVAEKRLRPKISLLYERTRHLVEEWRFLLFTVTVIVYVHTWKVKVIGITTPPFGDVTEPPFYA